MYISDRDRVSVAIFPTMLARWYRRVIALAPAPNEADRRTLARLVEAEAVAYAGLEPRNMIKVKGRVERLHDALLGGREGAAMITVFLTLSYAMGDLIAQGRMVLTDGSPLAVAYDDIAGVVAEHGDMMDGADRSARKAARKMVDCLIAERVF